jgi:hypothetical protein
MHAKRKMQTTCARAIDALMLCFHRPTFLSPSPLLSGGQTWNSVKTDYFYFDEGQTYRIAYDPKEMCCTEAISKENKGRADYAQVSSWDLPYDLRFSGALETGFQVMLRFVSCSACVCVCLLV